MIADLFAIKAEVEADNEDITMWFTFLGDTSPLFNYYLLQDLQKVVLAIFLVVLVLWTATSSLFIACAGIFQILVSFPIGLFVWCIVLAEPGVTYLMVSCLSVYTARL